MNKYTEWLDEQIQTWTDNQRQWTEDGNYRNASVAALWKDMHIRIKEKYLQNHE